MSDQLERNRDDVRQQIRANAFYDTHIERMKAKVVYVPDIPKKVNFWRDKPLGRTLSLRNKTGKTIAGVGLTLVAGLTGLDFTDTLNTGLPMEELLNDLLLNFDWRIILTMLITSIAFFVIGWAVTMKYISETLGKRLKEIVSFYKQAIAEESEGGKAISEAERKVLVNKFVNAIEQVLYDYLGIRIDLNKDGK